MPSFSKKSLERLGTCDPELVRLFTEIIKEFDCTVLCGHRGREDQEKAFEEGRSKARFGQSKHNSSPSKAVDVMPYPINWNDSEGLADFAGFVLTKAEDLGIKIRWGGHFKGGFFDGPHYELED